MWRKDSEDILWCLRKEQACLCINQIDFNQSVDNDSPLS